ncbi:MAG: anthranilate synthase component I [Candidatus Nanopelagicaceae bacterium]
MFWKTDQLMRIEEFREFAKSHTVIPVTRTLRADSETPLSLYSKLAKERTGTFLLESAENGRTWSRYSFIGVRSDATLTESAGVATWSGVKPAGAPEGIDPLKALEITTSHLRSVALADLPPLTSGLVGYMGYDAVRRMEKLPSLAKDDLRIPELSFMLISDLAIFDHTTGVLTLIANAINWDGSNERVDEAYRDALSRLDRMQGDLSSNSPSELSYEGKKVPPKFERNTSSAEYCAAVLKIKEEILAGEAFQVVLSQRFTTEIEASALDVYRALRVHNPSPYMYLLRFTDGIDVVGSSPEALVKIVDRVAMVHPIAGTRPRGRSIEEDNQLADELLADTKERAEHLMLVDLGRNDLGRVCKAGSVEVIEFMNIERYSHVMHIVSTVTGELNEDVSVVQALSAVFPAGTLSGAPKPRAMEIIEELEPTRRGLYGGIVGYIDFRGNLDSAIAIRTALIKDGKAYVQAGAGVVADSVAESEDQECVNKAAAVLTAIATANSMRK